MTPQPIDHWKDHARQWSLVRPPLRPCAEDNAQTAIESVSWLNTLNRRAPGVLVLGVTPELTGLPFAPGTRVVAVDNSPHMIRALWQGANRNGHRAVCADWRALPLAPGTINLALADGSFSALPYPAGYSALTEELRRLMPSGSRCVIRCFMQINPRETVEEVFSDLAADRIGNFHILKWRLAMALQPSLEEGVAVGSVWEAVHARWRDAAELAGLLGWPLDEVRTIQVYRGIPTRYTFPTEAEYRAFFPAAGFSILKWLVPAYELGERCPTLVLERL
jgi:hypothetical protein